MNPGNSGGALIDSTGKLIGLPSMGLKNAEGIGMAVSSETIEGFLERRVTPGAVPSPALPPTAVPAPTAVPKIPLLSLLVTASELGPGYVESSNNVSNENIVFSAMNTPNSPLVSQTILRNSTLTDARQSFDETTSLVDGRLGSEYSSAAMLAAIKARGDPDWFEVPASIPGGRAFRQAKKTQEGRTVRESHKVKVIVVEGIYLVMVDLYTTDALERPAPTDLAARIAARIVSKLPS